MTTEQNTFEFELVGPERKIIDGPMWQAVLPGSEGEFGVRLGHMALVSSLKPGVVSIWRSADETPHKYFISGGFADVSAENCTVLAEEAIALDTVTAESVEEEIKALSDQASLSDDPVKQAAAQTRLALAQEKLRAVQTAV